MHCLNTFAIALEDIPFYICKSQSQLRFRNCAVLLAFCWWPDITQFQATEHTGTPQMTYAMKWSYRRCDATDLRIFSVLFISSPIYLLQKTIRTNFGSCARSWIIWRTIAWRTFIRSGGHQFSHGWSIWQWTMLGNCNAVQSLFLSSISSAKLPLFIVSITLQIRLRVAQQDNAAKMRPREMFDSMAKIILLANVTDVIAPAKDAILWSERSAANVMLVFVCLVSLNITPAQPHQVPICDRVAARLALVDYCYYYCLNQMFFNHFHH